MKAISLPIGQTVSFTTSGKDLLDNIETDSNGNTTISILISIPADSEYLELARENGSKIITSTVYLERVMNSIISDHLFIDSTDQKTFFIDEILYSSNITFSFKKDLILRINELRKIIIGENKSNLEKLLRKIMDYRNAFAHGEIIHDGINGLFLEYFKGKIIRKSLTDEYWNEIEIAFTKLDKYLQYIRRSLDQKKS